MQYFTPDAGYPSTRVASAPCKMRAKEIGKMPDRITFRCVISFPYKFPLDSIPCKDIAPFWKNKLRPWSSHSVPSLHSLLSPPPLPLPPSLPASAPSAAGGAPPRPGASEAKHPRATCNSPLSLNERSPLTFCLLNINGGNSASDQIRGQ